jgi:hypothetical protein
MLLNLSTFISCILISVITIQIVPRNIYQDCYGTGRDSVGLIESSVPSSTIELKDFHVEWTAALQVITIQKHNKVLWKTLPRVAFIAGRYTRFFGYN